MTNKEKIIIEKIMNTAMNNPAGYLEDDEFDIDDESPDDISIYQSSMIILLCKKLLNIQDKQR